MARLRGAAEGPTLAMICHVDTVPADPAEWTLDPWSGEVRDGYVWGRGALDMKDQVAAEVGACVELGRAGWRPAAGDLLLVVSADEETGAHKGAQWLCQEQPEKVRCDLVVNEGAGLAVDFQGRRYYTLAVGEKGVFRFKLSVEGTAGHGSLPRVGDNALLKLAPLLEALRRQPDREASADTRLFLERLLGDVPDDLDAALERIRDDNPELADLPRPETELLAGWAIARCVDRRLTLVDLCTGSGAIAKAVADEAPGTVVHAVELDEVAHGYAAQNLAGTGVDLRLGDAFTAFDDLLGTVHVVVCNPPYVPLEAWESVAPEAREHDPHLALFSGVDGLDAIRRLAVRAAELLVPGGVLGVEHADVQGEAVPAVLSATGRWGEVRDHRDLAGRPRFTTATLAR